MVYIMLAPGFEEMEAIAPIDLLRRANIEVTTVGIPGKRIPGSHGIGVETDISVDQMKYEDMDMIVLPGGLVGVTNLKNSKEVTAALEYARDNDKFIAAICAAPTALVKLGITDGKNVTCYPSCEQEMTGANVVPGAAWVRDGKLITGTSAGCATPFALALVAALRGQEAADDVAGKIVIR